LDRSSWSLPISDARSAEAISGDPAEPGWNASSCSSERTGARNVTGGSGLSTFDNRRRLQSRRDRALYERPQQIITAKEQTRPPFAPLKFRDFSIPTRREFGRTGIPLYDFCPQRFDGVQLLQVVQQLNGINV
jgi:hypothetical protein